MNELVSVSPAEPEDEIGRYPIAGDEVVADAVARAREAFPGWRDAGFEARANALKRFRDLVKGRVDELATLISREMGKALWDAKGEAALVPAKVDVTLADGMAEVSERQVAPGARATFHPRGVLSVLGPFNFPAHLPNGHIVPALATGNTVVFKPSELTPAVGEWMAQAWRDAELPRGVFEIVQGAASTGAGLALHPDVDGVLFTGSYEAGRALAESTLDDPGKILALEMGGKNAIIVMDDADLDIAISEAALSICATTGQRCSCASRLFVHTDVIEEFSERLRDVLENIAVGFPLTEGVFMGPLVSRRAYDKVTHYRSLAAAEASAGGAGGERLLLAAPGLDPPFVGPGLVRFDSCDQFHPYQRHEIFGPEAAIYPITDLDQAIAAVNDSEYGLVAAIIAKDRARYEHCVGRIRTGLLNWNKGTIGASGKLPFGGIKKSGNDRPAGISAGLYCTIPQAHLENSAPFDPTTLPPGMPIP